MCKILADTRWIMLTSFSSILVLNGDYWAISFLASKETLGVYYFGFQLTFSMAVLFGNGVEAVMMPTFSRLEADIHRQLAAFHKAVRLVVFGATLASFSLVLGAPALLHFLWAGKWDSAIPVVQLLGLSLPLKMAMPLCRSLMEGRGEWRFISYLLMVDGGGTVLAAWLGGFLGGISTIALIITGYNLVFALIFYGLISIRTGAPLRSAFISLVAPFTLGIVALSSTVLLTAVYPVNNYNLLEAGTLIGVYLTLYFAVTRLFAKESLIDAANLVLHMRR